MADHTAIEWTDATWNPTRGCTRVSEGCRNCYAEVMAARFSEPGLWGEGFAKTVVGADGKPDHRWTGKLSLIEDPKILLRPCTWKQPRKIFVNSTSDLGHEALSDWQRFLVFAVMAMTHDVASTNENNVITSYKQRHIYQVLTKRPAIMRDFVVALTGAAANLKENIVDHPFAEATRRVSRALGHPAWMNAPFTAWQWIVDGMPGLWLGVSTEDQATADERIPLLLETPAAMRFVSAEPLLGPIDLSSFMWPVHVSWPSPYRSPEEAVAAGAKVEYKRQALVWAERTFLSWIIVGGESGPNARPMHPAWARSIRDQCQAAGAAFFFKQYGEHWPAEFIETGKDGETWRTSPDGGQSWFFDELGAADPSEVRFSRVGKKAAGRLLDGREWSEFPDVRDDT